jgi:hypothetical protein
MKKTSILILFFIIYGCKVNHKTNLPVVVDSTANRSVDKDSKFYAWNKVIIDGLVFDSIYLYGYAKNCVTLESNSIGIFKFFSHNTCEGVYYNFMGLVDTLKKKWIFRIEEEGLIFPTFNGASSNNKYFLFSFGDAGGSSGIEIFNLEGKIVFQREVLGSNNKWNSKDEFEFWDIVPESVSDTLPKLEEQYAWVQKFLWRDEKVIETDSITKRIVE